MTKNAGFWAGFALAAPFYAEFFPWSWVAAIFIPLFCISLFQPPRLRVPSLVILPMSLLLLLHVFALIFSETPFAFQVVKEVVIAVCLLSIYLLSGDDSLDGFFYALIPLGIISAFVGLVKAALLDRGYLLGFIVDGCQSYPAGSALCVNYNNLGLLWLIAALGCIRGKWWGAVPFLIAAGALSSSRRFIGLMFFLPLVWILLSGREAIVRILIVCMASMALVLFVSDPDSFELYRFGTRPYTVLGVSGEVSREKVPAINRSTPGVIVGTLSDGVMGASSRLSYWKMGYEYAGWFPKGWGYHVKFSCAFSSCTDFHYPHMSVLSAWIVGGAFFGFVAVIFYILPFWCVWVNFRSQGVLLFALLFLSLPYSLISGDTIFSQPIYLACMLVVLGVIPEKNRVIST